MIEEQTSVITPEFRKLGDSYIYRLADMEAKLSSFREDHGDLKAELRIYNVTERGKEPLYFGRLNLHAPTTRSQISRTLSEQFEVDWHGFLTYIADDAVQRWRVGEPAVDLGRIETHKARWLLYPYIEFGGPTILYADGGTGKSVVALCMAYSVAAGKPLLGRPMVPPTPVMYLDWETDAETHAIRFAAICEANAFGEPKPRVLYKRMVGNLADNVEALKQELDEAGVGLIIIDSLLAASAGPLEESNTARSFVSAIRYLDVAVLALTHVTKPQADNRDAANPFGSIFWHNMARNTWFIESAREEGGSTIRLRFQHKKSNNGMLQKQHGYELRFDNAGETGSEQLVGILVKTCDLRDVPEFNKRLSWSDRINGVLASGAMSVQEMAEEMGLDDSETKALRTALSREKKAGRVINFPNNTWGLVHHG